MFIKKLKIVFVVSVLFLIAFVQPIFAQFNQPWKWIDHTIVTETPTRPTGQEHVLNLTAPKLGVVRVGFVGLGMRGPGAVKRWCSIPGVQIVALCDYEQKRAENCQNILRQEGMPPAILYSGENGYEELCKRNDIDLVYIAVDWIHHFQIAKW